MLPGVYEFRWDGAHVIFLGLFLLVLTAVATVVVLALRRAREDMMRGRAEAIRWHQQFDELPAASRACRHEVSGDVRSRTCERGFDCRACPDHARFRERAPAEARPCDPSGIVDVLGLQFPLDRFYDRGHTWVRRWGCGRVRIGLDALAARLVGEPDAVLLPAPGVRLRARDTAWRLLAQGTELRILSPVDGVVRATGGPGRGWYLEVESDADLRHLLREREVRGWVVHEMDRLHRSLMSSGTQPNLTDGGTLLGDPLGALPAGERGAVRDALLLQG
jgi:hypothetical protein